MHGWWIKGWYGFKGFGVDEVEEKVERKTNLILRLADILKIDAIEQAEQCV